MSRTINSIRNIKYALVGQFLALLANFVTRMVFVRTLNAEYLGINGLFTNILSILSLAELGIGSAIVYSMYKPLAEKDEMKLKALMNFYRKAYILIGFIVMFIGVALTPFLKLFVKDMPDISNITVIYLLYVMNSGFSYLFTYKRTFLIADQKKYIESIYQLSFQLARNIFQIVILLLTANFILYFGIQLLCTIVENVVISKKTDKLYPFLKEKNNVTLDQEEKTTIYKNVKAMMIHKLGTVVVMGTDNILISKFVGIIEVGIYSNYLLIINSLNTVFHLFFHSMTGSIGNLGATESKNRNIFIFNCIDLLGFWIYAFATICLINLFNPFINLWLGHDYLFPMSIVIWIVIIFYLTGRRISVLTFRDALGLFWHDRYKPIFESVINLVASIILVQHIGISGIFIGTIISTLTTCFWIEPYVLYKYGFNTSLLEYMKKYVIWSIILLIVGWITWYCCSLISNNTFIGFVGKVLICTIIPNILFLLVFWRNAEFQYLLHIVKRNTSERFSKKREQVL